MLCGRLTFDSFFNLWVGRLEPWTGPLLLLYPSKQITRKKREVTMVTYFTGGIARLNSAHEWEQGLG